MVDVKKSESPTIADAWDDFATAILGTNKPSRVVREYRRTFYAGAFSAIRATIEVGTSEISEEDGTAALMALYEECLKFAQDVMDGKE